MTKLGFVDWKKLREETQKIIDKFKLPIHPTDPLGSLSVAFQQMVEIMKSYHRNSQIIAFDEPTSSLADKEVAALFDPDSGTEKRRKNYSLCFPSNG